MLFVTDTLHSIVLFCICILRKQQRNTGYNEKELRGDANTARWL